MKKPTNFTFLLFVVGSLFFYSATVLAQAVSSDIKLDEFDPKTEDTESFKRKAVSFLNVLKLHESGVTGQVNLYTSEPLGKFLLELAGKDLEGRLDLLQPGIKSSKGAVNIEFWIVQKGSEGPFPIVCGLCDCPPPASIDGKAKLDGTEVEIEFSAEISGGDKIKFVWSVTGGKIIKGQGTDKITVRPDLGNDVAAEVEWLGNEVCGCRGTASFVAKFGEREL